MVHGCSAKRSATSFAGLLLGFDAFLDPAVVYAWIDCPTGKLHVTVQEMGGVHPVAAGMPESVKPERLKCRPRPIRMYPRTIAIVWSKIMVVPDGIMRTFGQQRLHFWQGPCVGVPMNKTGQAPKSPQETLSPSHSMASNSSWAMVPKIPYPPPYGSPGRSYSGSLMYVQLPQEIQSGDQSGIARAVGSGW